jgi:hypothetical protein
VLRRGGPLAPAAEGATVRARAAKTLITDGPFAETKELLAGFWIVELPDRATAVEVARHCPHVERGPIALHALDDRTALADAEIGAPFLLALRSEPGLADPDGAKRRAMMTFVERLEGDGTLFERAALGTRVPPAHLASTSGQVVVSDGPFADPYAIDAYLLIRAGGRARAVELAARCPHAHWAPVEVREILFFDPV